MSEVKKIATRASYGNALVELGKKHEDLIVLDADLAAATQTGIFKKEFPERHIDCGIAECNMMGIAAGIATTGKVPFASTFAMFAAGRAYEQVRNSVGYPKLNVKIGATHGGISVGEDGATHQCCEDFALMRTIPGMVVASPSDDIEAFLYSGITVFDPYKLEEMEVYCQEMPILVGDIEGAAFQATDKNCMHNIRITEQSGGPLKVWELPDTEEHVLNRYLVSCDIGGAHRTSDFSDIVVIDRYDCLYGGVPAVVAEWHGHCDPDQLAMKCAQIAAFYNNAFLVVESNTAYSRMNNTEGDPSELFFPILLPLYDNLYNSSHSKLLKRKPKELRWGFHTSRSTKSAMIKNLQKVTRDKGYIEREQRALDEYSYFMFYNQNNTFGAVAGEPSHCTLRRIWTHRESSNGNQRNRLSGSVS